METRDEEQTELEPLRGARRARAGTGRDAASTQATDADGADRRGRRDADEPPRVEPGPAPAPGPFTRGGGAVRLARPGGRGRQLPAPPGGRGGPAGDGHRPAGAGVPGGPAAASGGPIGSRWSPASGGWRRCGSCSRTRCWRGCTRTLSDEDALLMALAAASSTPPHARRGAGEVEATARAAKGRLSPAARDMLEKAPGHGRRARSRRGGRRGGDRRRRARLRRSPHAWASSTRTWRCWPTVFDVAGRSRQRPSCSAAAVLGGAGGVPRRGASPTPWRWTGTGRGCSSCSPSARSRSARWCSRSGKESDFYIDCKQTALTAEGHFLDRTSCCSRRSSAIAPARRGGGRADARARIRWPRR